VIPVRTGFVLELNRVPGVVDGHNQTVWAWRALEDEKREELRMI
jgi:hypothetical protein